jgi:hypothetical protein
MDGLQWFLDDQDARAGARAKRARKAAKLEALARKGAIRRGRR